MLTILRKKEIQLLKKRKPKNFDEISQINEYVRLKTFKTGSVVRTSLIHVNVTMHRIGANTIDVYGFRSMAKTLCHELTQALSAAAARN